MQDTACANSSATTSRHILLATSSLNCCRWYNPPSSVSRHSDARSNQKTIVDILLKYKSGNVHERQHRGQRIHQQAHCHRHQRHLLLADVVSNLFGLVVNVDKGKRVAAASFGASLLFHPFSDTDFVLVQDAGDEYDWRMFVCGMSHGKTFRHTVQTRLCALNKSSLTPRDQHPAATVFG